VTCFAPGSTVFGFKAMSSSRLGSPSLQRTESTLALPFVAAAQDPSRLARPTSTVALFSRVSGSESGLPYSREETDSSNVEKAAQTNTPARKGGRSPPSPRGTATRNGPPRPVPRTPHSAQDRRAAPQARRLPRRTPPPLYAKNPVASATSLRAGGEEALCVALAPGAAHRSHLISPS
jgi:hypothetical protein